MLWKFQIRTWQYKLLISLIKTLMEYKRHETPSTWKDKKLIQFFVLKLQRTIWIYRFLWIFCETKTVLYIKTNREENRDIASVLTRIIFTKLYPQLLMTCHVHCKNNEKRLCWGGSMGQKFLFWWGGAYIVGGRNFFVGSRVILK